MDKFNFLVLFFSIISLTNVITAMFAPYIDITKDGLEWAEIYMRTGVKTFTIAFVLAGIHGECDPTWGAMFPLNDSYITKQIKDVKALGGELVVATGGAVGPYLEQSCTTVQQLLNAYKKVLDYVGSTHLDIDIEAPITFDVMNQALAQLQKERAHVKISFTLIVQGEDYGLNPALGTELLKNALKHGVRIDVVNPMAMEFWTTKSSWGDAVVDVADEVVQQIKQFWPQKTETELYRMMGVTPMIGKNLNGKVFDLSHAKQLVEWANSHGAALLAFWSIGRDNGGCAGGAVSAFCSSIVQSELEFTRIFSSFNASSHSPTNQSVPELPEASTQKSSVVNTEPVDCSIAGRYYVHETDCSLYYWCYDGVAHVEKCIEGTIWDNVNKACNWPELVTTRSHC